LSNAITADGAGKVKMKKTHSRLTGVNGSIHLSQMEETRFPGSGHMARDLAAVPFSERLRAVP
jgi:hypothetical protein